MQFGNVFDGMSYDAIQYAERLEARAADLRAKGQSKLADLFMQGAAEQRAVACEYQHRKNSPPPNWTRQKAV